MRTSLTDPHRARNPPVGQTIRIEHIREMPLRLIPAAPGFDRALMIAAAGKFCRRSIFVIHFDSASYPIPP
jgi:hypothetical protein